MPSTRSTRALATRVLVASALAAAACSSRGGESARPSSVRNDPTRTTFAATVANRDPAPGPAPAGMVWIPGGEFSMGCDAADDSICGMPGTTADALPVHRVFVDGFYMDATEVTNEQFAAFVASTGYVTVAEKRPTREEFPGVPPEDLVAGSVVFTPTAQSVPLDQWLAWWRYQPGAQWRHPEGPGSDLDGRERFPVVQVCYEDALAFASWAGKRLPTEAEWEFAARGGVAGARYVWGDELCPGGKYQANLYQGTFPVAGGDSGEDGFVGLAPVGRFPASSYGLFDLAGNAWEWTSDWYRPDTYAQRAAAGVVARNPRGPASPFDPEEPGAAKRVQRGGSFLCTSSYCTRYLLGSRGKGEARTASNHVGFRCVRDPSSR